MNLTEKLSSSDKVLIAGLVGAFIAMRLDKQLATWHGKLFFLVSGMACAYYVTPLAMAQWKISADFSEGIGFLLGAFGSSLLTAAFATIKSLDFVALIKVTFFGGPKP